jgi:hypothetical protein
MTDLQKKNEVFLSDYYDRAMYRNKQQIGSYHNCLILMDISLSQVISMH